MSKDIKIEVIYYKNKTDVSLEFGLHGDYPMRLLSSGCDSIPLFFRSLKRAVMRSELIIVVGGYSENEYLPAVIARALGKKCVIPNYSKLGVITQTKYPLPMGADPLSPKNRHFSGFILENGSQAIISLTDNKKLRLETVEQFVVNYITEHHLVFNQPFAIDKENDDNAIGIVVPTEFSDISSSSVTADAEEATSDQSLSTPNGTESTQPDSSEPIENDISEFVVPVDLNLNETSETNFDDTDSDEVTEISSTNAEITEATGIVGALLHGITDAEANIKAVSSNVVSQVAASGSEIKPIINHLTLDPEDIVFDDYEIEYDNRHHRSTVRTICLSFSLIIIVIMAVLLLLFPNTDSGNDTTAAITSSVSIPTVSQIIPSVESSSSSDPTQSDETVSVPITNAADEDITHNDYLGETPDITLPIPSLPTSSSQTTTETSPSSSENSNSSGVTSSNISSTSSNTSSTSSSNTTTSTPSTTTSVSQSSSTPSSSSSAPSSSTSTPSVSSTDSTAQSSSQVSSSKPVDPNIDPLFTWDLELSIIDKDTGIKYTDSAVNIVAMIIEDEMSPTIDPKEALIAQSIVKYNWLINNGARNPNKPPTNALDPNPTPQALDAAQAAKGKVLLYGNTLAKTYCYAYSAGKTANYQDIWGGTAYPYLQSVDCPVDEELSNFETTATYPAEQIQRLIFEKCGIDVSTMDRSEWIKAVKYDNNNLYCVTVSIGGVEYRGQYLRDTLLSYGIRSSAYTIKYDEETDTYIFTCKGYGHGVGFSQRGAKAYALSKEKGGKYEWNHEQILMHFFPGTTLIEN